MAVGRKIKKQLKEKGITVKKFAEDIDENRSLVTNYLNEKTKPSVKFLYKAIAYFPDLDLNYLFRDTSEVNEQPTPYGSPPKRLINEIEERLQELRERLSDQEE